MKALLADFSSEKAEKEAVKLSESELQAALALLSAMPKKGNREFLRSYLYRAWASLNPNAAWKAALTDPIDKERGLMLSFVAGTIAKTKPTVAVDLAAHLEMNRKRELVMDSVFSEWLKSNADAAIAYSDAHPDAPIGERAFWSYLLPLTTTQPVQAAHRAIAIKEETARRDILAHVATIWVDRDPSSAASWAGGLSDAQQRLDAGVVVNAAIIARTDPEKSIEWLKANSDPQFWKTLIETIAIRWMISDTEKASAWLASDRGLSASSKEFVRLMAKSGGDYPPIPGERGTTH